MLDTLADPRGRPPASSFRSSAFAASKRYGRPADGQPARPAAGGHHLVQPADGVRSARRPTRSTSIKQQLNLPPTIATSFSGTAQVFQDAVANQGLLLLAAVLTIYIVLGILYESFIHPLTILTGLPAAAAGALLTLRSSASTSASSPSSAC